MSTQPVGIIPEFTRGDRMRKARELTGMTTREFAHEIGVSQGTVTSAENDRKKVRPITIKQWAIATGVPETWLLHGEGGAPKNPDPVADNGFGAVVDRLRTRRDSNPKPSDPKVGLPCAA